MRKQLPITTQHYWYLERSPQAAAKFDSEFDRALTQIARVPLAWAPGPCDTRRFLLRGYPYLVIYRERREDSVQILAVAHTSRKPEFWKSRL